MQKLSNSNRDTPQPAEEYNKKSSYGWYTLVLMGLYEAILCTSKETVMVHNSPRRCVLTDTLARYVTRSL